MGAAAAAASGRAAWGGVYNSSSGLPPEPETPVPKVALIVSILLILVFVGMLLRLC